MTGLIAQHIFRHRKKLRMTQDEMAQQYRISGPGVFKFEKGYVTPSLRLWLRMAEDMGIPTRTAVLMHVHDKLPEEHRQTAGIAAMLAGQTDAGPGQVNFRKYRKREELRAAVTNNQWLPAGLRELAVSDGLWALYRPTGQEINALRDAFGPLGEGTARDFCDGLRLIREFQAK